MLSAAEKLVSKGIDAGLYYQAFVMSGLFDKKGMSVKSDIKVIDQAKAFVLVNKLLNNKAYEENKPLLALRGMLYLNQADSNVAEKDKLLEQAFLDFNKVQELHNVFRVSFYTGRSRSLSLPTGAYYQLALAAEKNKNLKAAAENHRNAIARVYSPKYRADNKGKDSNETSLVDELKEANPYSYQWLMENKDNNADALNEYVDLLLSTMGTDKNLNNADLDEIVKQLKRGDEKQVRASIYALYAIYNKKYKKSDEGLGKKLSDLLGGYQPKKAFKYLKKLAAIESNITNERALANAYYYGTGTAENEAKAVKIYKEIVKQEGEKAYYNDFSNVASYYEKLKTKNGYKNAAIWYKKLLVKSPTSSLANNQLGYLYYKGYGVAEDKKKAHQYFLAGAQEDDVVPMGWVISNYINGRGVDKSKSKASYWINKLKKLAKSDKDKKNLEYYQNSFKRAFK